MFTLRKASEYTSTCDPIAAKMKTFNWIQSAIIVAALILIWSRLGETVAFGCREESENLFVFPQQTWLFWYFIDIEPWLRWCWCLLRTSQSHAAHLTNASASPGQPQNVDSFIMLNAKYFSTFFVSFGWRKCAWRHFSFGGVMIYGGAFVWNGFYEGRNVVILSSECVWLTTIGRVFFWVTTGRQNLMGTRPLFNNAQRDK